MASSPARSDSASVTGIYRYPVKGLSAEPLDEARLRPNRCLEFDRIYAIENGGREFDADQPRHLPKTRFLMLMRHERLAALLMRHERLAALQTRFDHTRHLLSIARAGSQVAAGRLDQQIGRQVIEQFLAAYLPGEVRGAPRIVFSSGHNFTDSDAKWLSIVNLASVRDLARVMDRDVDPLRFRANIYIDGIPPWSEFAWVDRQIFLDGLPVWRGKARIRRCAATNVDPATGARDMAVPHALLAAFGHAEMGIYVETLSPATLSLGKAVTGPDA